MDTRASPPATSRGALLRAGLTEAECFVAARAARGLPGAWWVQRDEDDRGHAAISLVPNDGGAEDGAPAFLLWREDGALRLACGQGEFYADLGAHADVDAALGAARRALEAAAAAARWFKVERPASGGRHPVPVGRRPLRDPAAAAVRLADWADEARCVGRTLRADRLLLRAWEAYDRPRRAAG